MPADYKLTPYKEKYQNLSEHVPTQKNIQWLEVQLDMGKDEPILFPLYLKDEMKYIFGNFLPWTKQMTALIEGWSERLCLLIADYHLEDTNAIIVANSKRRVEAVKAYQPTAGRIVELCNKHRTKYIQLS